MNEKNHISSENPTGSDDQSVQDALMRVQDKLYALIRMLMIHSSQDAVDVLQKTNAVILEHSEQHDPSKSIWAWFKSVAISQVKLYFRTKARNPLTYDTDLMDTLTGDVEENRYFRGVDMDEYLDALKRCMGKLPPSKRDLLKERYMEQNSVASLAEKYHVSLPSLTQLFYRLRSALQSCIERTVAQRVSRGEINHAAPSDDSAGKTFESRLDLFLDDLLPQDATGEFSRELISSPEKRLAYMKQAFLHAFLQCRRESVLGENETARPVFRVSARAALIAAAALAALFTGGALLLRRSGPPAAGKRTVPVALDRQSKTVENLPPAPPKPAPQVAAVAPPPAKPVPVVVTNHTIAVAKPQSKEEKEKPMNIASIKSSAVTTAAVATVAIAAAVLPRSLEAQLADLPAVSNVTFKQPFNSRVLEIGYTLSNGPGIVTVDITTNGVSIGDANVTFLSGEVNKVVQNGAHTIQWDTKYAWPNHTNEQARAVVTAWALDCPPDYMVVYPGNSNICYYTSAEALPDGGLTNFAYKTTRIVMRKIPAGSFDMGAPITELGYNGELLHHVTLTNDFYIGIYEVTQAQYAQTWGGNPARFTVEGHGRPVEQVSYNTIRGATNADASITIDWPTTGDKVGTGSFLDKLRKGTGLDFDLPTDAQWEYACRAGTSAGQWSDGSAILSGDNDTNLSKLARYKYTGGQFFDGTTYTINIDASLGPTNCTAVVGSYAPNRWGLYDMHGNVKEWVKDWYTAPSSAEAVEPAGAVSGTKRVERNGCYVDTARSCRSVWHATVEAPTTSWFGIGFRLYCPALAK